MAVQRRRPASMDRESRVHILSPDLVVSDGGGGSGEPLFDPADRRSAPDTESAIRGSSGHWSEEWRSIVLLLFLYLLQGIPLGMGSAFAIFLQYRKISYGQQALFSFITWPFSIKFLWAPVIDSLHFKSFGRRKSWLVPVQYLIGLSLLVLSHHIDSWFGDESHPPDVRILTALFLTLSFLAATQDIAVDGWALTILSRRHVGHASTCNSVGQTAGYFLGNVVFLALESKDFANRFVYSTPQPTGLVTMAGYMHFWAWAFFVTTTLVALFKHEQQVDDEQHMGVLETYRATRKVLVMPAVVTTAIFLLTVKIGFGITDGVTALKLIEAGVPKENLALLSIPMTPVQLLLPLFIARYIAGERPLDVFVRAYMPRLACGLVFAAVVKWTFAFNGEFPAYYYVVILLVYAVHQVFVNSCYVSLMAFFARVSDPALGGTYMTLLNTLCNLGGNWPMTLAMWGLEFTTTKACSIGETDCSSRAAQEECTKMGGICSTTFDGFYVETFVSVLIGFLWFGLYGKRTALYIQRLKPEAWIVAR